jgi:site-specific DNA recombinase
MKMALRSSAADGRCTKNCVQHKYPLRWKGLEMDALGYIRVSKVGGREGDSFISPAEQRKAIESTAKRERLNLVEVLEELDASGGDNTRPKWNEALERVESGEVKALVVWNLSRFSRSVVDGLKALERVEAAGGALYSSAGDVGDTTPTGKMSRTMFLAIAQMERERARDNFAAAQANAIARGIHTASVVPTGYTRNPETKRLDPNEQAPLMKKLFEKRAEGAPYGELVRWFVAEGGSPLTNRATISAMLRNRAYLGEARRGDVVNLKAHAPIVSMRLFDAVQAMVGKGRPHTGKSAAASLLGGLVVCDGCGRRMATTMNGSGKFVYRCDYQVCPSRATCMVHELDSEVVDRLLAYWNTYTYADISRTKGNEAEMATDLAEAREMLADTRHLLDKFVAGKREYLRAMTPTEFADDLAALKAEVTEAEVAVEMAESTKPELGSSERVADLWNEWSHETRKEWLSKNLETVIVKKSGAGRGNPVHVAERMALGLSDGLWLHRKAGWSAEPFAEPQSFLRIVSHRKAKRAKVRS